VKKCVKSVCHDRTNSVNFHQQNIRERIDKYGSDCYSIACSMFAKHAVT